MADDRLTSALSLARRGFRVFPLRVRGWTPAHTGWQREATLDPVQIMEWWSEADYNIGVATGEGLLVVDVDDKPGKHGSQSLEAFKLNGATYDTFTVRTPTGGRHLYFRAPDVSNTAGSLGEDLDIRSAGGYVVGPLSELDANTKNAVGGRYELVRDCDPRPVPEPFLARLATRRESRNTTTIVDLDDPGAVARAILYLTTLAPLAVEGHGGDHTTFTVAAHVKDLGVSEDVACDLMSHHWLPRCTFAWTDESAEQWLARKVANAYAYGQNAPGVDHPAAQYGGIRLEAPRKPGRQWFRAGRDDWAGSVEWLYKGLLPTTGVCLLAAPSQAGKTFVALHLARSLDDESDFFGVKPHDPGSTIYLVGEAYGSVKQRLAAFGQEERAISLTYVGALAARGAWAELVADIQVEASRLLVEHGRPVRLIVLDTLSASAILESEDDNALAATVMRLFADLSVAMNALFLVVHHPPKSGGGYRGASAIGNNADYVLEIERDGMLPVRELKMIKSRDGEQKTVGTFTLVPVEIGKDADGEAIVTMTLSTSNEPRRPTQATRGAASHAPLLVECVEWTQITDGDQMIEGQNSVDYQSVYGTFKERFKGSKHASNIHRAFNSALIFAQNAGALTVVQYLGRKYIQLKTMETT